MIDEEILELRRKLNKSITNEEDYRYIYTLSLELDELIATYYKKRLKAKLYTKASG